MWWVPLHLSFCSLDTIELLRLLLERRVCVCEGGREREREREREKRV
jgi:hypothetical protein